MSETPERQGRSSGISSRVGSRSNTPHRRRSKTPVRTPTRRRRATIVNASLVPNRRHRPSTTPQNILRVLSRALIRDRQEPQQSPPPQLQLQLQAHDTTEAHQTREEEAEEEAVPTQEDEKQAQWVDAMDFGLEEDNAKVPLDDISDKENEQIGIEAFPLMPQSPDPLQSTSARESLSELIPTSQFLSDIVQPLGLMDDEDQGEDEENSRYEPGEESGLNLDADMTGTVRDSSPSMRSPPKPKVKRAKRKTLLTSGLSKPNVKSVMRHAQGWSSNKISAECEDVIVQATDEFFSQVVDDLVAYTQHEKKDTISFRSALILLKRQRIIDGVDSLVSLSDEVLNLEDSREVHKRLRQLR